MYKKKLKKSVEQKKKQLFPQNNPNQICFKSFFFSFLNLKMEMDIDTRGILVSFSFFLFFLCTQKRKKY